MMIGRQVRGKRRGTRGKKGKCDFKLQVRKIGEKIYFTGRGERRSETE